MTWGKAQDVETEELPETIEELEDLALDVREEIAQIEAQFGQRKAEIEERALATGKVDRWGGPRNDPAEWSAYAKWRGSAAAAKRFKEIELSEIKNKMKSLRAARGVTGTPVDIDVKADPLAALFQTARRLAGRIGHDKMDERDQAVMDAVKEILTHKA